MEFCERVQVSAVNGIHGHVELGRIVGVRQQIPVIEHVHPNRSLLEYFGGEPVFEHLTRGDSGEDKSTGFVVVFDRLPSQFKTVLEALDGPLLLQCIQCLRSILQSRSKQNVGSIEILETLFPSNVRILAD